MQHRAENHWNSTVDVNMIANCGVVAGLGPDGPKQIDIAENIDERSSRRLLHLMATCLTLQYLPDEVMEKEIPIISGKLFSLKLWTKRH